MKLCSLLKIKGKSVSEIKKKKSLSWKQCYYELHALMVNGLSFKLSFDK